MLLLPSLPTLRRRALLSGWILLAALPVIFIATRVVMASRNIVFWDEFDTALDLILRINSGADWNEIMHRLFAVNNEHRTVTSRLLFAASYALSGTVNFHVIGAIGNLFIVGACATLIAAVQGWEPRIRLGVILAFLIFQLEHFENFLWSGASIDHFQVVMLAVGALFALQRPSRAAFLLAVLLALLATFTLAHGCLVWVVGGLLLADQRRWQSLLGWGGCAVIVLAAFLHGFEVNPGHHIDEVTLGSVQRVARYWLALLGGPMTLGSAAFAPVPGLLLLAGLGFLVARGAHGREPVVMAMAVFCVLALGLVAFGRAELAGPEINSRYLVLGALAWALMLHQLVELGTEPGKPFRLLVCLLPALAAFNISANVRYTPLAEGFIEVRDRAATRFKQYGEDGRGISRLHPQEGHADALLKLAAERGVYKLPRVSEPVQFPLTEPSTRIVTYIDELLVNDRAITAGGWAMIPGKLSKRGQVYLVLRSDKSTLIFSSVTLQRPDVAAAYKEPKWRLSGFRAVIGRARLPAEDFEVGVLIADGGHVEYVMTPNRLHLAPGREPAALRAVAAQDE